MEDATAAILAAIARLDERLDHIEARLDRGEVAPPSMSQWTTAKGAARDLHISADTVLRRARAIGCAHEIGRLVLVDAAAVAADLVTHPVRRGTRRVRNVARDVTTTAR
jgi:hypothetical protein